MTAQPDYCQQAVREADRDLYVSVLFAPEQHRSALYAIYAFHLDLARIRDVAKEPLAGEIRLQWWRDVLQGQRAGEAAAHPIAHAVLTVIKMYSLDAASFVRQVDAREFDIYNDPMTTVADLESYFAAIIGATYMHATAVLSDEPNTKCDLIAESALAYGYFDVVRLFGRHSARGQGFVPDDVVRQHGAVREDALSGRMTPEWSSALADLRNRARAHLDAAADLVAGAPLSILPVLLPLAVIRPALKQMNKPGYDPFRPPELSALWRQWAIWRAAANPSRIFG